MRLLGIDPGLRCVGWGIIDHCQRSSRLSYVAHGVIQSDPKQTLDQRLHFIFTQLQTIVQTHTPIEAAIEETFMNNNPQSAIKLGMARGVAYVVPALSGMDVFEYAANSIKKTITGAGHADKSQVAAMVQLLVSNCPKVQKDAADALAIAICHAHQRLAKKLLKENHENTRRPVAKPSVSF